MTTQIPAQGIAPGAITADKLAAGAISQDKFAAGIQTGSSGPTISTVTITDNAYSANGQTHMPTEGGYFKIVGTNFASGAVVAIGNTLATATTFVSSTELHVQAPAKAEGSYQVQVTNTNGGWAFKANAITYSGTPTWVTGSTLTNGVSDVAYSLQLSATGATSYSLAPGSSLPTGLTLSAGGLLSGTVTVGSNTNYTFTIRAIDAENQYSSRTFDLQILAVVIRSFSISPAVNGKSTWDLDADGNLNLGTGGTWDIVPDYSFSFDVKMWGGGGGGRDGQYDTDKGYGGPGGTTFATLAVTSGNTYKLVVAGTPDYPRFNGRYSGIFLSNITQANALLMAGGGGAGAYSTSKNRGDGGAGGGLTGGTSGYINQASAGTQTEGGTGTSSGGTNGTALTGGNGGMNYGYGAGGDGYWGGGGSGYYAQIDGGSGGAGGSGYIGGTGVSNATTYQGVQESGSLRNNAGNALTGGRIVLQ